MKVLARPHGRHPHGNSAVCCARSVAGTEQVQIRQRSSSIAIQAGATHVLHGERGSSAALVRGSHAWPAHNTSL